MMSSASSHHRYFVRICEFRDSANDCDDDSSSPIILKRFVGNFLLSFLTTSNNNNDVTTVKLEHLQNSQNGLAGGSSINTAYSDDQPHRISCSSSSSSHFSPNDYEQMPLTERSVVFRRNATHSSEPKNGTFSPHSFAISFDTVEEFAIFCSKLDALRRPSACGGTPTTNGRLSDNATKAVAANKNAVATLCCSTKKRKYGGGGTASAAGNADVGCSAGGDCAAMAVKMVTSTAPTTTPPMTNPSSNSREDESRASEFDSRTEQASAVQYFQFYGSLYQQQNMLQDFTRTATYQRAIFENWHDFRGKVVLDVGAGTGILSFFAAQAGAKRVYAVEASSMAAHCKELVKANGFDSVIVVLCDKIEEVELPEQVDVIVSEPMGYMLVNERMLESYMYARKFLRPGGRMFPSRADLHLALFNDDALYAEQQQRAAFWAQQTFHGVALGVLQHSALDELFRQPVVDSWSGGILVSQSVKWTVDFERDPVERLHRVHIPFTMNAQRTCHLHGIASWFDVAFEGTNFCGRTVWLSTAPTEPLTHWYQVRCLIKRPMLVLAGQTVRGSLTMVANEKQSYDMELDMYIEAANTTTTSRASNDLEQQRQRNELDLKMPYFRYTGQPVVPPPGAQPGCPSDQLNQAVANLWGTTTSSTAVGCMEDNAQQQQQQQLHQQHQGQQQQQQRQMLLAAVKRQQQQQQHLECQRADDDDQPMMQNGEFAGHSNTTINIPPPRCFTDGSTRRLDDDDDENDNDGDDDDDDEEEEVDDGDDDDDQRE